MKPFIRFVAKLYPRSWRERYGAEFETLLDDTGTDARIAFNVLIEAIGMQIQSCKRIAPAVLLWWLADCFPTKRSPLFRQPEKHSRLCRLRGSGETLLAQ